MINHPNRSQFPNHISNGMSANAGGPVLALNQDHRIVSWGYDDPIEPDRSLRTAKRDGMIAIATYANTGALHRVFEIK
jgi:hypothetical protein